MSPCGSLGKFTKTLVNARRKRAGLRNARCLPASSASQVLKSRTHPVAARPRLAACPCAPPPQDVQPTSLWGLVPTAGTASQAAACSWLQPHRPTVACPATPAAAQPPAMQSGRPSAADLPPLPARVPGRSGAPHLLRLARRLQTPAPGVGPPLHLPAPPAPMNVPARAMPAYLPPRRGALRVDTRRAGPHLTSSVPRAQRETPRPATAGPPEGSAGGRAEERAAPAQSISAAPRGCGIRVRLLQVSAQVRGERRPALRGECLKASRNTRVTLLSPPRSACAGAANPSSRTRSVVGQTFRR